MKKVTKEQSLKGLYHMILKSTFDGMGLPLGNVKEVELKEKNHTVLVTMNSGQKIGYTTIL